MKTLKERNNWQVWLIILVNGVILYSIMGFDVVSASSMVSFFDQKRIFSVGLVMLVTTALNGLTDANTKARLVFLRWNNALPGHRAFSKYADTDPRIDRDELIRLNGGWLPDDPAQQNQTWYKMYKSVQNIPSVAQSQRDFLLMRDYTGLSALFIITFAPVSFCTAAKIEMALTYASFLIFQFCMVRLAASNYGIRFVSTVMAEKMKV